MLVLYYVHRRCVLIKTNMHSTIILRIRNGNSFALYCMSSAAHLHSWHTMAVRLVVLYMYMLRSTYMYMYMHNYITCAQECWLTRLLAFLVFSSSVSLPNKLRSHSEAASNWPQLLIEKKKEGRKTEGWEKKEEGGSKKGDKAEHGGKKGGRGGTVGERECTTT